MYSDKYNSVYQLNRYHERRAMAIAMLGGVCVSCGTEENLEIDHVDPQLKSFTLSVDWTKPLEEYLEEVKKCQLLCKPCHTNKTSKEQGVPHGGGVNGKRNCKCEPCMIKRREYMRTYMQEYRRLNGR